MKSRTISKSPLFGIATVVAILLAAANIYSQGRYANRYSRGDVDRIIANVENSGDEFRRDFRTELDRSSLSGYQRRTYSAQVDEFERETDRLRSNFDTTDSWWSSREDVRRLVSASQPLNETMNSISFRRRIERQWNRLRNDINTLADTYDLAGIAGGGWQGGGGGWNGGGPTSTPPSWARGTFYGWDPATNQRIVLTISNNGRVTSSNGYSTSYGTYYNGNIHMEGVVARLNRSGSGIRSVRTDTGVAVTYSRQDVGDGGGNSSRPPSWAIGTFYTRDPATGRRIELTISSDGRVTSRSGGRVSYGTYFNDTIEMEGVTVRVDRLRGAGIRTTRVDTGEIVTYTTN